MTDYETWKGMLGWRVMLAHYTLILACNEEMDPEMVGWAHTQMEEYRTRWSRNSGNATPQPR